MKFLLLFTLLTIAGCVNIKNAQIESATFNTAGWKSQAGVDGGATIKATTTPQTDVSVPTLP